MSVVNVRAAPDHEVLLLHGGALGDLILAYHFARRCCNDPATCLCVVARNPLTAWLQSRGFVLEGLRDDALRTYELFARLVDRGAPIAEYVTRFEIVINMLAGPDSAVHRNLEALGCRRIVSIDPAPDGSCVHIVDQWQERASVVLRGSTTCLRPTLDAATRAECRRRLRERLGDDRDVRMIHPGSGSRSKCGPVEWFEAVFDSTAGQGLQAVWMIGPDEMERDGATLLARLKRRGPVIVEESIFVAADLLAGADAVCGNDSGMAHLSALIGLPTTVVFATTDASVWKPIGEEVMVLNRPWSKGDFQNPSRK